jgi:hypothetical protein
MKKVLVLGDSLTLPRNHPQKCEYSDTWPELLKTHFKVHQVSIGGGTIKDLFRQIEYHIAYDPEIVILQGGIVDCAPRTLTRTELTVLENSWVGKRILGVIKKNSSYIRKLRKRTYISPKQFLYYADRIKQSFPNARVISVGILPANQDYETKIPGITSNICVYNDILRKVFRDGFLPMDDMDRSGIMSDDIHLNAKGQRDVFEKVIGMTGGDA